MQTRNLLVLVIQDPKPIIIYVHTQLQFEQARTSNINFLEKNETESVGKNEGLKHVINYKIVLEVENVRV